VAMPGAGATAEIELEVPMGAARTVQVLGISLGTSGLQCDGVTSKALYPGLNQDVHVEAYELGKATTDVFEDVTVQVANTYSPSKRANCATSTTSSLALADGVYTTGCIGDPDLFGAIPNNDGDRRIVTISGLSMTIENFITGDPVSCGGAPLTRIVQTATYTLGNSFTDSGSGISGHEITLTFGGTMIQTQLDFLINPACGTSLVNNEPLEDISGQCGSANFTQSSPYPGPGTVRYDIVGISGSNLYFGKFFGSSGSSIPGAPLLVHTPGSAVSPGDRSTEFLTAVPYVK
jgi:hypothetical protein